MLALLSGRRSTDQDLVNASFADMGLAIAGLLKSDVDNNEDDEELVAGIFKNNRAQECFSSLKKVIFGFGKYSFEEIYKIYIS